MANQLAGPLTTPATDSNAAGTDADHKRFYTFTADLREGYDDNIYTSSSNKTASFTTDFSPSVLFRFPMENSEFSARVTTGFTYYNASEQFDYTAALLFRFTHAFSDRFSIDIRDQVGYFTEPSLFDSVGTLYRDGGYISNMGSIDFSAQWTPLVSSTTSYNNNLVQYQSAQVANGQDSDENAVSQSIGFAILPKYTLVFAGTYDNITYDDVTRGYTTWTGMTGGDWQALPSLSLSVRVGGSVTQAENAGDLVSPYGTINVNWQLGQRSSLTFNYSHTIAPTDVTTASAQEANRMLVTFAYDINRSFSVHLTGIYTHSNYEQNLVAPGTTGSFTENDAAVSIGLAYHIDRYLDADAGYTYSMVSSDVNFRDYSRNQFYLGLRGTY